MAQYGPPFDFSKLDAILDRVMSTPKFEVLVGYPNTSGSHSSKRSKSSITLPTLAAIHDLGAPGAGIPERAFMRQSVENRRAQYTKFLSNELRSAYRGEQSIERAYGRLGAVAVGGVQVEITRPSPAFVALQKSTIARKGSSKPLIDTGQLRQAVTFVVRKPGDTK